MDTLTGLLFILFGLVLAVSILLWALLRPREDTPDTPIVDVPEAPKTEPKPKGEPAPRFTPNRLAPPPKQSSQRQESDAFERFLKSDD